MKLVNRGYVQSKKVAGVLASLRVEDLTPSAEVISGLSAIVNGQTTTEELLKQVRLKYVTLRRV